ncbi:hypothetical protein LSM04_008036 [Trypanosoma melophagium]|uniref:uncharacterized protein n=1 Tax=Trypanosoma melophagium TaxID=715481 RepID=UPI00351A5105|nr:hypothetical protein LSM04_008036 [Trypanosoma melophagium]
MLRWFVLLLHKGETSFPTRVFSPATARRTPFLSFVRRARLDSPESTRQTSGGPTETQPLSSVGKLSSENSELQGGCDGVSTSTYRRRTSTPYSLEKYRLPRSHRLESRTDDALMDPGFGDVVSQDLWEREVVLTPSTLLQRLESIFPPATEEARKKETGHRGKRTASTASVTGDILGTNLTFCESAALADRLRPCCYPVPWKCVVLSRVDAPASSAEREKKTTTQPCMMCLFPSRFFFDPKAKRITAGGEARISSSYGAAPSIQRRAQCVSRKYHPDAIVKFSSKLQRVAVLHHIPGLPDPTAASMTLQDYSQFLRYGTPHKKSQQAVVKSIPESPRVMHCMGREGMNNRDIGIHSVRGRLFEEKGQQQQQQQQQQQGEEEKDEIHVMSAEKSEKALDGGVGVWIIHPHRESIFFALRYTTASDHYEWLCPPQYTLFWDDCLQASTAAVSARSAGTDSYINISPSLSWAITPLRKAMMTMMIKSPVVSRGNSKSELQRHSTMMKTVLPTILYYCAANVPLTTEENSAVMMSLLADSLSDTRATNPTSDSSKGEKLTNHDDKKRRKSKKGNSSQKKHNTENRVRQLAMAWAPLPRTSRLLRGRQLMTNANTLAEALKYGRVRILR